MKKILAATLICAVSTFASWDKFPVIEEGKGEMKAGWTAIRQGNAIAGSGSYFAGIRFSPMANLELAALPKSNYTLGARYQIMPMLSAGVDIGFPIPGTAWHFTPNAQFSMPITGTITLGSNVDVTINTEDANENTEGMDLNAGVELDFTLSEKSTIWVGFDLAKRLTESENKAGKQKDNEGMVLAPGVGYLATLGNMTLGTFAIFEFGGEDVGRDPFRTIVCIDAAIKF